MYSVRKVKLHQAIPISCHKNQQTRSLSSHESMYVLFNDTKVIYWRLQTTAVNLKQPNIFIFFNKQCSISFVIPWFIPKYCFHIHDEKVLFGIILNHVDIINASSILYKLTTSVCLLIMIPIRFRFHMLVFTHHSLEVILYWQRLKAYIILGDQISLIILYIRYNQRI